MSFIKIALNDSFWFEYFQNKLLSDYHQFSNENNILVAKCIGISFQVQINVN